MNKVVRFFPAKNDTALLTVLESEKLNYLSGKIIKETETETHVVVQVPGSTNELRTVPTKKVASSAKFEIV